MQNPEGYYSINEGGMLPPERQAVRTCIIDHNGKHDEVMLYRVGSSWYLPGTKTLADFQPTHWHL